MFSQYNMNNARNICTHSWNLSHWKNDCGAYLFAAGTFIKVWGFIFPYFVVKMLHAEATSNESSALLSQIPCLPEPSVSSVWSRQACETRDLCWPCSSASAVTSNSYHSPFLCPPAKWMPFCCCCCRVPPTSFPVSPSFSRHEQLSSPLICVPGSQILEPPADASLA